MRAQTQLFHVNGKYLLAPDGEVAVTYADVEALPPVRDQDGQLHRSVIRGNAGQWTFRYCCLTEAERQYLESIFPAEGETFVFGHPDRLDLNSQVNTLCYRENSSMTLRDARGLWGDCSFRIREV